MLLVGLAFESPWKEMIRPPSECRKLRVIITQFPQRIGGRIAARAEFPPAGSWLFAAWQAMLCHRGLGLDELLLYFAPHVQLHSVSFLHQYTQEIHDKF